MQINHPLRIGSFELRNRLVLPGLTSNFCHEDGTVSDQYRAFLARRARGVGLVFTEGAYVHRSGKGTPHEMAADRDETLPGLRTLSDALHAAGSLAGIQLIHCGRQMTNAFSGTQPVAPSPVACPRTLVVPRELAREEIHSLEEAFTAAAVRAVEAGFDVVELMAGHGYLISEFLSPASNLRDDDYGGPLENRARFLLDVVERTRSAIGRRALLFCRINGSDYVEHGIRIADVLALACMLRDAGVDGLDVSVSVRASYECLSRTAGEPTAYEADFSREVRLAAGLPTITSGRVLNRRLADELLASGAADLVAVGRGLIADPDWTGDEADGIPCVYCNACNQRSRRPQIICPVNSEVGREADGPLRKAGARRRILVLGAGVAGLEAARVLADRGHTVAVAPMGQPWGGLFAGVRVCVPGLAEFGRAAEYFRAALAERQVRVVEGMPDPAPDVTLDARFGSVEGQAALGVSALAVLQGKPVAQDVLCVGAGILIAETALFLASSGHRVQWLAPDPQIPDAHPTVRHFTIERLERAGVRIIPSGDLQRSIAAFHAGFPGDIVAAHAIGEPALPTWLSAGEYHLLGDRYEASDLAERVWKAGELARSL